MARGTARPVDRNRGRGHCLFLCHLSPHPSPQVLNTACQYYQILQLSFDLGAKIVGEWLSSKTPSPPSFFLRRCFSCRACQTDRDLPIFSAFPRTPRREDQKLLPPPPTPPPPFLAAA